MASFSQSPFFSTLNPIKRKNTTNIFTFKSLKLSSSFSAESSPDSQENAQESQPPEADPLKLAFAKAKAYKKFTQSNTPPPVIVQNKDDQASAEISREVDGLESDEVKNGGGNGDVALPVKLATEKAKEYEQNKGVLDSEINAAGAIQSHGETNGGTKSDEIEDNAGEKEVPLAVKLAVEKAKEYKKNKGVESSGGLGVGTGEALASGLKGGKRQNPVDKQSKKEARKKDELTVSSIDFVGLGFSDKKTGRALPAGLVPISDPFPEGDLPDVEILIGDASKFRDTAAAPNPASDKEDDVDLYKPRVSTWGVFPRPKNISKTFGGGRTIRPGEALETAEDKAAKEARIKEMLAAYKSKTGLSIDPKLKLECEKALKDGNSLMDIGKLNEALPFYEKVMNKMGFQTELHGLAALQWSICQDSLSKSSEARIMYEKLRSHPSPRVSKKARQFMFGFQAMEMMKVTSSTLSPQSTGYQNYFEAFVANKTNYPLEGAEVDEDASSSAIPYIVFLLSPILAVLLLAAFRTQ